MIEIVLLPVSMELHFLLFDLDDFGRGFLEIAPTHRSLAQQLFSILNVVPLNPSFVNVS